MMDLGKVLKKGWKRGDPNSKNRKGGKQSKSEVHITKVQSEAVRSDFDKERVRLKEKEVRRNKYSKYIYELALPIELDR
jgi:hypothetical protein